MREGASERVRSTQRLGKRKIGTASIWSGLGNRPFDILSVKWHIICLPICRTTNMDLIITKKLDKTKHAFYFLMKNVCLKVNVSSVKIAGLYSYCRPYVWIDNQKVLLIIFSRENSVLSLCINLAFAIIATTERMFVFADQTLTLRQTVFIRN